MTDFLDLLEADLREAAERRGQPQPRRHRPPRGALKAVAALAVLALFVFGAARVVDRADDERAAQPTPTPLPTPTPTPESPIGPVAHVMAATEADPGLVNVMSATLSGYIYLDYGVSGATADPSLGTVVLYHPAAPHAKDRADFAAFSEKIDEVRPITKADEAKLNFPADSADVIVVYGPERQRQMLDDPKICAPAGGDYKLCLSNADEQRFSVLVRGDHAVPNSNTDGFPEPWWSWASLSPDGNSVLVETSNRCEFPHALIWDVAASAGAPVVAGVAQPLGWTTDGQAILWVPQPKADAAEHCRADLPEGLYLAEPGEAPTWIGDTPVDKSIEPRTPQALTG